MWPSDNCKGDNLFTLQLSKRSNWYVSNAVQSAGLARFLAPPPSPMRSRPAQRVVIGIILPLVTGMSREFSVMPFY